MVVLLGIGLLAGVITSVSPCVLPVLPVLLAGGASGRKPFRIITGLIGSFVVFTLFSSWLLTKLGLPQDLLRNLAIALLFVLAATLLVPRLGQLIERPFARLTRFRAGGGGFILGVSLGLVFVPCAGPVLAAVTAVAASNHVGWRAIVLTLAYAIGAAIPMLLIALGGRELGGRLRVQGQRIRIVSGAVIALVALGIAFNLDSHFQTMLPGYTSAFQKHVEASKTAQQQLDKITGAKPLAPVGTTATGSLPNYGPAPALVAGGSWIDSKPLTLASLKGKVVLLDFWTYSCINCLRTLPHLKAWYAAYHRDGLEIIGVHTPEFAFEHVTSNVQRAVKQLGIPYPVMQDNAYATWNAYGNEYWPAEYLIDKTGHIREADFGEGSYSDTETSIRQLLGIGASVPTTEVANKTPTELTTPESYLGFDRLDTTRYAGSKLVHNVQVTYTAPAKLSQNAFAYSGAWTVQGQRIIAGANAGLDFHFHAKNVYLVLGGKGSVTVSIPGSPATTMTVNAYKLYTLRMSGKVDDALLQLRFTPGVQAYAFTFG